MLLVISLVATGYIYIILDNLVAKIGYVTLGDLLVGTALIIVILIATKRTFGNALPILIIVILLYAKYGSIFPAFLIMPDKIGLVLSPP